MNFNGVFDDWNYMKMEEIMNTHNDVYDKEFLAFVQSELTKAEVDSYKSWVYEPQFMDYVVRGMKNFLKSPFKS
tara:strand:- start:321 stop:542 length:222 start_codon:yes stop_codon:yes gene_type:complete